jgi:hypothetical protein
MSSAPWSQARQRPAVVLAPGKEDGKAQDQLQELGAGDVQAVRHPQADHGNAEAGGDEEPATEPARLRLSRPGLLEGRTKV